MNTIESNKLIADFMGAKYDKDTGFPIYPDDLWLPIHGICNYKTIATGRGNILQYHESWDWIMPVIGKIYSSDEYVKYKYSLGQFNDGICINAKYIDSTYNDVIDYIKWYNQNKN